MGGSGTRGGDGGGRAVRREMALVEAARVGITVMALLRLDSSSGDGGLRRVRC